MMEGPLGLQQKEGQKPCRPDPAWLSGTARRWPAVAVAPWQIRPRGAAPQLSAAGPGSPCGRGDTWGRDGHDPLVASALAGGLKSSTKRAPGGHRHPRRQPELPVTRRDGGHGHRQHEATPGIGPPLRGAQPQRSPLQSCPQHPPPWETSGSPKALLRGSSGLGKRHFGDKSGPTCASGSMVG